MQILAEPGRFLVANACTLVAKVIGKAFRDGKPCYYINDGVYHTYSGQVFDHNNYPVLAFKEGEPRISAVFGPTCDAFDTITLSAELPDLEIGDLVYSENIGAYSHRLIHLLQRVPARKSGAYQQIIFFSRARSGQIVGCISISL